MKFVALYKFEDIPDLVFAFILQMCYNSIRYNCIKQLTGSMQEREGAV